MAYSTSNPPRLVWSTLAGMDSITTGRDGFQMWVYTSTDVSTVVDASNFFSNGYDLGMRSGDLLIARENVSGGGTFLTTMHAVVDVTSSVTDIAAAVAITSVTDND